MKHIRAKQTSKLGLGLVLFLAVIVLTACGGEGSAEAPAADDDAVATAQETEAGEPEDTAEGPFVEDGVVEIGMYTSGGMHYNDPLGIKVEPGTTVRFVNRSGSHTATAYHPDNRRDLRIPEGAEPFDSGVLSGRNATFEGTLEVEGVYDYVCTLHEAQGHVGRIVVGDPDADPAPPADGLPGRAPDYIVSVEEIMENDYVPFERR